MNIPKPKKKHWYKKWWVWLIIVFLFLILSGVVMGYYGFTKAKETMSQVLESYNVVKKDLVKTVSLEGGVQSKKQADLYFSTTAQVTKVNVQIGDEVNKDRILVVNKQQELKAPFDGVVTEVNVVVDELANPQVVAVKVESRETEIKTTASEQEVVGLKKDLPVDITFDAYPNILLTGKVSAVAERKDQPSASLVSAGESAGYQVLIDYEKPEDLEIKRDVSCEIEIAVGQQNNVLAVPLAAVKWEDDQAYVEIKTLDGSEKRDVELGFEGDEYVEITSGLAEGEELVLFSAADLLSNAGMFN